MIVAEKNNDLEQAGMGRTVQAKIKASRKLFNFFSDGVYSNKPVAIARELVANAIDSHVMAGRPNVPVEVTLPTALDPMFIVQDFGLGMSEDFLFDNYLVYAEGSTKDGANEAIGGFGIGKAAVFSYTDQFSLVSIHDGVKGVYSVFVGEDGIPAISQITTTTTDDHNGVTISFPVEDKDIQLFHEAAQTALQYFTPLPTIHNGTVNPPDYSFTGANWALRPQAGELGVILGGVRYPVVATSLTRSLQIDPRLKPLLNYGIDLTMPIGSVGVALSREALSYDQKTSDNIAKALNSIFEDVKKTFGTMFDNEPTWWSAAKKLYQETGATQRYSQNARQQLLAANAVYKGKKLETSLNVKDFTGAKVWVIAASSSWGRQASYKTSKYESFSDVRILTPGEIGTVIVDDLSASPKNKTLGRIRHFVDTADRSKSIVILQPNKPTDIQKAPLKTLIDLLLENLGSPDVKYVSDLEPPPVVAVVKAVNVRPKVRMFTWSGGSMEYTGQPVTNLTPARGKPVVEIKYTDQPDTGILVELSNFDLPKGLREKLTTGIIKYSEVYYANKIDADKLDKFKKFDDVWAERLAAKIKTLPKNINQKLAIDREGAFTEVFNRIKHVRTSNPDFRSRLTQVQRATPFGQLVDLWEENRSLTDEQRTLTPFLSPKLPDNVKPSDLMMQFRRDQRSVALLLDLLQNVGRFSYSPKLGKDYIDLLLKTI